MVPSRTNTKGNVHSFYGHQGYSCLGLDSTKTWHIVKEKVCTFVFMNFDPVCPICSYTWLKKVSSSFSVSSVRNGVQQMRRVRESVLFRFACHVCCGRWGDSLVTSLSHSLRSTSGHLGIRCSWLLLVFFSSHTGCAFPPQPFAHFSSTSVLCVLYFSAVMFSFSVVTGRFLAVTVFFQATNVEVGVSDCCSNPLVNLQGALVLWKDKCQRCAPQDLTLRSESHAHA